VTGPGNDGTVIHSKTVNTNQAVIPAGQLTQATGHPSFDWRVRAYAGDMVGYMYWNTPKNFHLVVKPVAPDALWPDGDALQVPPSIVLGWNSLLTHSSQFAVEIHDGAGCVGAPLVGASASGPNVGQGGVVFGGVIAPGPYSWRVASHNAYCPSAGSLWSGCRNFSVQEPPPPAPPATPDVIDGFWGATGSLLAVFSKVSNADTYEMALSIDTPGNVLTSFTWTPQQLHNYVVKLENDLCSVYNVCGTGLSVSPSWAVIIDGTQAVNTYYYQVRACNAGGCSAWSSYSLWDETLPWPWW
jgi:hypothetical protein